MAIIVDTQLGTKEMHDIWFFFYFVNKYSFSLYVYTIENLLCDVLNAKFNKTNNDNSIFPAGYCA